MCDIWPIVSHLAADGWRTLWCYIHGGRQRLPRRCGRVHVQLGSCCCRRDRIIDEQESYTDPDGNIASILHGLVILWTARQECHSVPFIAYVNWHYTQTSRVHLCPYRCKCCQRHATRTCGNSSKRLRVFGCGQISPEPLSGWMY